MTAFEGNPLLAALISRLAPLIGQGVSFRLAPDSHGGGQVQGTLSGYRIESIMQGSEFTSNKVVIRLLVTFAEAPKVEFPVIGFAELHLRIEPVTRLLDKGGES